MKKLKQKLRLTRAVEHVAEPVIRASAPASSLLSAVLTSSIDGIAILQAIPDEHGKVLDFELVTVNPAGEQLLRRPASSLVGVRLSEYRPRIPADKLAGYARVVEDGTSWTARFQWFDYDGRWFDISAVPFAPWTLVVTFRDVTELLSMDDLMVKFQQRQHVLERQALHDPLTGAANRLLVETRLEHAVSRLQRTARMVAVMFIDLDGFKPINDTYGHAAGDHVLRELATRLRSAARSSDTVGRLGGDEFVVVCEDIENDWDVDRIAHRLGAVCEAPISIGDDRIVVTASVGVALATSSTDDTDKLLHDADMAMYRAKSAGGGQIDYSNDTLHDQALKRRTIELGLSDALEAEELHIGFDTVVDRDDRETARRARVGWLHPAYGPIDAATLANAAATFGLVPTLTDWIIEQTLDRLAPWLTTSTEPARFVIVDVAFQALLDDGFADRLLAQLERHRCAPESFCIAFDGAHMTAYVDDVQPALDRLAGLGVRVARNGVGVAGTSLTYVRALPIDVLILDDELTERPERPNELGRLVIEFAQNSGRLVMATSASDAQRELLHALGVDLVHLAGDTTLPVATGHEL